MKKILPVFICLCLTILSAPPLRAHLPLGFNLDPHVLNWVKSNVSPTTQLPYSFYVPEAAKTAVYEDMNAAGSVNGSIERTITEDGLDIYDGAVYQIILSMAGTQQDMEQAFLPFNYYWQGAVGDLWNIRSGYPISRFVYDTNNPEAVTSNTKGYGERGFIFRIIHAEGKFLVTDPLDGKKTLAGFPEQERLHWVDWKPVAGENAWVVIAAMQMYHKKYYNESQKSYIHDADSVELKLSEELARAAMILQADIGGIRMAPLGTHRNLVPGEEKDFTEHDWWYRHISTENNLSWYAAFRMLYEVTGNPNYKEALEGVEKYLRYVWNNEEGGFHQGTYEIGGKWMMAQEHFALDVQTWGIACLGPQTIDRWFGKGAAYRIWHVAKEHSGVFDTQGRILGVGYTDEHDRISVEWSAGAMVALEEMAQYYLGIDSARAQELLEDKMTMRRSMENLHYQLSETQSAYSYSSRRGWIPFGWNSHDPQVMSLASTGWMMFVDAGVNPFWFIN